MKKIIGIFAIMLCINCYAFDHSYEVTGEDENGNILEGTIYSNNGELSVNGELEDENGNTIEFNGQWNGYGQISGETEDGISVDLTTN